MYNVKKCKVLTLVWQLFFFRRLRTCVKEKGKRLIMNITPTNNYKNINYSKPSFGMNISGKVVEYIETRKNLIDKKTLEKILNLKLNKNSDNYVISNFLAIPKNVFNDNPKYVRFMIQITNKNTGEGVFAREHINNRKLNKVLDYLNTKSFLKNVKKLEDKQEAQRLMNIEKEARRAIELSGRQNYIEALKSSDELG